MSCSTFPHLLAPNLLPSHSFPQLPSLRAHFISPLCTWLPATLLCRTLSPPMWSRARKSIKPLITMCSSGSSTAQLLTQQIREHRSKPWQEEGAAQELRQPRPRVGSLPCSHRGVTSLSCSVLLPLQSRRYAFSSHSAWET